MHFGIWHANPHINNDFIHQQFHIGRSLMAGDIGQAREDPITVTRRSISRHPEASKEVRGSLGIPDTDLLRSYVPRLDVSGYVERADHLIPQPLVL